MQETKTVKRSKDIQTALSSEDWLSRRRALIGLSHQHNPHLYGIFIQALTDPVSDVRHAAIIALSRLGDTEAVTELAKPKFLQARDANIRWAVARALGTLGDIHVIDHLFQLADDEEWRVRNEAMEVLREKVETIVRRGDPSQARILIRMLSVPDEGIVDLAKEGLVDISSPCLDLLIEALNSVHDTVRIHAANILGSTHCRQAAPQLIQALEDSHPQVRLEAARALGASGDPKAIAPLISGLSDRNEAARQARVDALVRFGEPVLDSLHSTLKHARDKHVISALLSALGALQSPSSIHILVDHLNSGYYIVRHAAVKALQRYGTDARDALLTLLVVNDNDIRSLMATAESDANADNRVRAIRALGELEDHRSTPLLKSLLNEPDSKVTRAAEAALVRVGCAAWGRCGALEVLGELEDDTLVQKILPSLSDDSPHVRYEAVKAIGRQGAEPVAEALRTVAVHDAVAEVRTQAFKVLRELPSQTEELAAIAIQAMGDEDPSVRLEVTRILGDLVHPDGIDVLIDRLADPVWGVRVSAENALINYGPDIVQRLLSLLDWDKSEALYRVIHALGRLGDTTAISRLEMVLQQRKDHRKLQEVTRESLMILKGETGRKVL